MDLDKIHNLKTSKSLNNVFIVLAVLLISCSTNEVHKVNTVLGEKEYGSNKTWLSHEHLLVDFIGAEQYDPNAWDRKTVIAALTPYLNDVQSNNVDVFVDPTPPYLGRDVLLLREIAKEFEIDIVTNTGLYGAYENKYIPSSALSMSAQEIAEMWITEFLYGIENTDIKPGFMKISVDAQDTLDTMHVKLVKAAALTHIATGMIIASHTGPAVGLWPQLDILKKMNVHPSAFIWVHAQNENDYSEYLKAARTGVWISFDGLGWELENHVEKIIYARKQGFLNQVLISHDAGWYDPQKESQQIVGYTNIFEELIPTLQENGFTQQELDQLLKINPVRAFGIKKRLLER